MALELVEGLSVVRCRNNCPWRQMIPVEVGNGPDVANVIENDVVFALARLGVLALQLELLRACMILKGSEIKAGIGRDHIRRLLLEGIATAALASIFCMLRSACTVFVLDAAEVPEEQGVSARCQVVPAEVCKLDDMDFGLVLVQGLDDWGLRGMHLRRGAADQVVGLADVENLD